MAEVVVEEEDILEGASESTPNYSESVGRHPESTSATLPIIPVTSAQAAAVVTSDPSGRIVIPILRSGVGALQGRKFCTAVQVSWHHISGVTRGGGGRGAAAVWGSGPNPGAAWGREPPAGSVAKP